ncbi:MAG: c-type cytochrome domain-containing protein [Bradyrhizobium sp.]
MQKLFKTSLVAVAAAALIGLESMTASDDLCAAGAQSFSEDILPLLKWRCSGCHEAGGDGYQKSGLDLTTYEGVMKGTKFGRMVIPGDAASSNLMLLLDWRVSPQVRMPHNKKKLSICDRDAIRAWINEGAKNN